MGLYIVIYYILTPSEKSPIIYGTCTCNSNNTFLDTCTGLDPSWTNVKTDSQFPVNVNTQISVSCKTGYSLQGDTTITCVKDVAFSYTNKPICILGMWLWGHFFNKSFQTQTFRYLYWSSRNLDTTEDWHRVSHKLWYKYHRGLQCWIYKDGWFWDNLCKGYTIQLLRWT